MARGAAPLSSPAPAFLVRLDEASVWAVGRVILRYLRGVSRLIDAPGSLEPGATARRQGHRTFLCYRNQDVLALSLALCLPAADEYFGDVDFVCDDSFPGRVTAVLIEGLGREVRWLRRGSLGQRARDVQQIIRSRRSLGIAVDTGGPYGEVRPSLLPLAARCEARLVPIVALVSRSIAFRREPRLGLPLPRARLAIALGEAVDPGRPEALASLQAGLTAADERARHALAREASRV